MKSKTYLTPNIQLFAESNAGSGDNGGDANQNGGNGSEKTYTQQELDNIVNERTGRATKSALSSFFKQKGLSEEEANNAIASYLENKKNNTPDVNKLQSDIVSANNARLQAEINQSATLEAIKQGVDVKSIPYLLKMADFKDVVIDEKIDTDKLGEAIKKVLEDVPALKANSGSGNDDNNGTGFNQIGGAGGNDNKNTEDTLREIFGVKKK